MPHHPFDDIVFLVWRVYIGVLSVLLIMLYFFWKGVLKKDYQKRFTLSLIIRQKLSEINAYPMLKELEDHKGSMKQFLEEIKKREPPKEIPIMQNLSEIIAFHNEQR